MSWFRVDDTLAAHPKTRKAGLAAMGLWTVAGSWSSQQLTEGFVPEWFVLTWPQGRTLARRLVVAELWEPAKNGDELGWLFHDWTDTNPTAEQEKERRRKARDRQRKLREKSAAKREAALDKALEDDSSRSTSRVTSRVSHGAPSRPDPSRPSLPTEESHNQNSSRGGSHVSSAAPPKPPLYSDRCSEHGDVLQPGNCGNCADVRKANAARPRLALVAEYDTRPPWCGECNEWTRQVETQLDDGRDASRYCKKCHPLAEEAS